jgi:hypothetical protein
MQLVNVPQLPSEFEVKFFNACLSGEVDEILVHVDYPIRVRAEPEPTPTEPASRYALLQNISTLRNPTRRRFGP